MCVNKPEKIIAVTGKSSEIISAVLMRALKACNREENINVTWGGINEIIDASGDVDILGGKTPLEYRNLQKETDV